MFIQRGALRFELMGGGPGVWAKEIEVMAGLDAFGMPVDVEMPGLVRHIEREAIEGLVAGFTADNGIRFTFNEESGVGALNLAPQSAIIDQMFKENPSAEAAFREIASAKFDFDADGQVVNLIITLEYEPDAIPPEARLTPAS